MAVILKTVYALLKRYGFPCRKGMQSDCHVIHSIMQKHKKQTEADLYD